MGIMIERINIGDLRLGMLLSVRDDEGVFGTPETVEGLFASDSNIVVLWRELSSERTRWETHTSFDYLDSSLDGYWEQEQERREIENDKCPKYPDSEILPDEDNNCSLCGAPNQHQ